MLPIAWYLLKVMVCSGIMYGYYWLLLHNKVFHGYNRFYLMVGVLLSLLLPLIKINFWQPQNQQQAGVIQILQAVSSGDAYMDNVIIRSYSSNSNFDWEQLYPVLYLVVSLIMGIIFIRTLYLIRTLLKQYPKQLIGSISFVNTDAKSTPFSFLHYIFWNRNIDMDSTTGKQIFKHELAHVQEKHTYDKLLINLVLVLFWCNPFFWLIRKELNMIHEFIADKKAVEDNDTASFAAMILQATYPQHRFQLTNNFFYSPIKRRLLMLTKNNNPKVNYWGRIMVLPLTVLVFAAFSLKTKSEINKDIKNIVKDVNAPFILNDTPRIKLIKLHDSVGIKAEPHVYYEGVLITKTTILKNGLVVFTLQNGKHLQLNQQEAFKRGLLPPPPPPPGVTGPNNNKLLNGMITALFVVDGEIKEYKEVENMNPSLINSLNVLKGKTAFEKYGEKGKNGVVEVTTKDKNVALVVNGYQSEPLYVIDGVIQDNSFSLNTVSPENIQSIDVLKDATAAAKYGEKGKQGVVLITTKINKVDSVKVQNLQLQEKKNIEEVTVTGYPSAKNAEGVQIQNIQLQEKKDVKDITVTGLPSDQQWAAAADQPPGADKVFTQMEISPLFPGGDPAWKKYLEKNLNPQIPYLDGWKAGTYTIIVQFIVHTDGSVTDVTTKDFPGSKTAQHCIDLIKNSPKWSPAIQNDRKVNAYRKQPITLVVEEKQRKR